MYCTFDLDLRRNSYEVDLSKSWYKNLFIHFRNLRVDLVTRHCMKGGSRRTLGGDSGKRTPSKGLWRHRNLSFCFPISSCIPLYLLDANEPHCTTALASLSLHQRLLILGSTYQLSFQIWGRPYRACNQRRLCVFSSTHRWQILKNSILMSQSTLFESKMMSR